MISILPLAMAVLWLTQFKEMELRIDARFEALKGDMSLVKWMMGALAIAVANFFKQFF